MSRCDVLSVSSWKDQLCIFETLNEVTKMLRDCTIEEIIKLPKIAIIGNQSVEKSSLIEAISQIKVPRASGTCTRCPMEVILSRSEQKWHAKISLRFAQDDPRVKSSPSIDFMEIDKKEDTTLALRRAQLAILDPGRSEEHTSELQSHS